MQDDGSGVALLGDEVDGGPRHLHPIGQGLLVDVEAVAAHPAEGGDEGGVDVEHRVGVGLEQLLRHDGHEAGHHHQVDVQLPQPLHQGGGHRPGVPPGEDVARDAGLFGPLQGVGVGGGGQDGGELSVHQLPPPLGVDEGL